MKGQSSESVCERIMLELDKLSMTEAKDVLETVRNSLELRPRSSRKSKIELDRELYEFILSLDLEFSAQKTVRSMCIAKFGLERAPSRTALSRMWERLLCAKQKDKKQC